MKKFLTLILTLILSFTAVFLGGCNNEVNKNENLKEIDFGLYPQTKVEEQNLIDLLNGKVLELPTKQDFKNFTSFGFYKEGNVENYAFYIDVKENNQKYRGVYLLEYRPLKITMIQEMAGQEKNGYSLNTLYWFKFEPVKWEILSKNNGYYTLLSQKILDSAHFSFNKEGNQKNDYESSDIREFLNNGFYNLAFSDSQKQNLVESGEQTFNDKVFLLTIEELTSKNYGFTNHIDNVDIKKQKQPTDYAKALGAFSYVDDDYKNNGEWWTRSADLDGTNRVYSVSYNGKTNLFQYVYTVDVGVVPTINLKN